MYRENILPNNISILPTMKIEGGAHVYSQMTRANEGTVQRENQQRAAAERTENAKQAERVQAQTQAIAENTVRQAEQNRQVQESGEAAK